MAKKTILFLFLTLLASNAYGKEDKYKEAKQAALTALLVQIGAKDNLKKAGKYIHKELEDIGLGEIATVGIYAYTFHKKKEVIVKHSNFTFIGNKSTFKFTYSFSF